MQKHLIALVMCLAAAATSLTPSGTAAGVAAQGQAQTQTQTKTPPAVPPSVPFAGAGLTAPADPTPAMRSVMAATSAYADIQCVDKEGEAATDCRLTALWDAAKCTDAAPSSASSKSPGVSTDQKCARAAGPSQFEFEVASIKPHTDNGASGRGNFRMNNVMEDGYRGVNVNLRTLMTIAYNTSPDQEVKNLPGWADADRYDVDAKTTPEVADLVKKLTKDDRTLVYSHMILRLITDRVNLKAHIETKQVPVYDLVIGKNGPKLKAGDEDANDNNTWRVVPDLEHPGSMIMIAKGVTMRRLGEILHGGAGRPIFDKTGLKGIFDITLQLAVPTPNGGAPQPGGADVPTGAEPEGGSSTVTDIVSALGLKLVSSRGPVNVLVIDHIDRPGAN